MFFPLRTCVLRTASQTDALILDQHPVVSAHTVRSVAEQRDINLSQTTILPWNILLVPQRMLRINRNKHNAAVAVFEFVESVLEGEYFGRTAETECSRDEQDDDPRCTRVIDARFSEQIVVRAERDICHGSC
jgi:hypothetical protein